MRSEHQSPSYRRKDVEALVGDVAVERDGEVLGVRKGVDRAGV